MEKFFATAEGPTERRRAIFSHLAACLRAEQFPEADEFLEPLAKDLTSDIGSICLALTPDIVSISGWEVLWARLQAAAETRPITAIGLDLSSHVENPETANGWVEPGIETSLYSDHAFPFSTSSLTDLQRLCSEGRTPWQGSFEDLGYSLETQGLGQLHTAIRQVKVKGDATIDADLGMAYLLLRFHQAVVRDARRVGLPAPMPVLVGEHDFYGPYIDAAYYVATVGTLHDVAEELLAKKRAERERARLASVQESISELVERRAGVLHWPTNLNPRQRANFVESVEARDAMYFKVIGIPLRCPTWRMPESEFRELVNQVRRHYGLVQESAETPKGGLFGRITFGRKGL